MSKKVLFATAGIVVPTIMKARRKRQVSELIGYADISEPAESFEGTVNPGESPTLTLVPDPSPAPKPRQRSKHKKTPRSKKLAEANGDKAAQPPSKASTTIAAQEQLRKRLAAKKEAEAAAQKAAAEEAERQRKLEAREERRRPQIEKIDALRKQLIAEYPDGCERLNDLYAELVYMPVEELEPRIEVRRQPSQSKLDVIIGLLESQALRSTVAGLQAKATKPARPTPVVRTTQARVTTESKRKARLNGLRARQTRELDRCAGTIKALGETDAVVMEASMGLSDDATMISMDEVEAALAKLSKEHNKRTKDTREAERKGRKLEKSQAGPKGQSGQKTPMTGPGKHGRKHQAKK